MIRYAVYYAPEPDHPIWVKASQVIGYDAVTGAGVAWPAGAPFDAPDWAGLTAEPRRYGFHATLKAPMELAAAATEADLVAAAASFAATAASFRLELDLSPVKGFLALTPTGDTAAVDALAAACVRDFDCLRAPLSAADRARRLKSPLTPSQVERLDRWGYPYVFEDFRFHMTLTDRLAPERQAAIAATLRQHLAPLPLTLDIDAICLFRQPDRDGRFTLLARFPFAR